MKGFIAAALSRVPLWKTSRLTRPVYLMFSYDEEIGCLGAPSMIAEARRLLPRPGVVIVGEPTGMRVANAHKGICTFHTRVTGVEAHSSLTHLGVSAVMVAAEMIERLRMLAQELAAAPDGMARFAPPHSTLSVNRIEGGTAINILAGACEFGWDLRMLPGQTSQAILARLAQFAEARLQELFQEGKRCTIETKVLADVPPLQSRSTEDGNAEALAREAAQFMGDAIAVPFATEGGQFQGAGWSSIICGPGSIDQAHKPDEFIERSQLMACEGFLERAVTRQCGTACQ